MKNNEYQPLRPTKPCYTRIHTKFINENKFVSKSFIDSYNKPVKFTNKNYREQIRYDEKGIVIGSWEDIITRI